MNQMPNRRPAIRQTELQRRKAREAALRRAKRKHARALFFRRALLCLVLFLLLTAIAVLGFWLHFNHTDAPAEEAKIAYRFGGEETADIPGELALQNGVLYIDFTAVAEYLEMPFVGGAESMRYILPDSDGVTALEEAVFYPGHSEATVNGQSIRLEAPVVLYGDRYLLPLSFLEEYLYGIKVTKDSRTVSVDRLTEGEDGPPLPLSFLLKPTEPLPSIPDTDENIPLVSPEIPVEFKADLSAYEEYMNPADRNGYLLLVNTKSTLSAQYQPADLMNLVDTRQDGRNPQKMVKTAAMALEAMFIELRANGYTDLSVTSAYRTYSYQKQLFDTYTDQQMANNPSLTRAEAEAIVETFSARPGTSEHQAALCCDMHNLSSAQVAFAKQKAYLWLKENCWKFGFILRYPEGKEDITGITFEPWHYRFVGRYHAKAIYESGLCLEEYLETLQ